MIETRFFAGGRWALLAIASVAALIALVLGGCAISTDKAFTGPPLRVGVSPDYPPVIFEHEGEIVGIEADLARRLGQTMKRRIEFVRIPFPDLIDALEANEIDVIMSGLSITPERELSLIHI